MIEHYGGLGLWGIAFLTQLLATFGIMVSINLLVWGMILPLVGMIMELTIMVLAFMAYNQFWDQATMASPNAYSAAYLNAMDREMALHTAEHVAAAFELYMEYGNWIWGAYMNSDDMTKKEWRKDKDFLMMFRLFPEDVEGWGDGGDDEEGGDDGEMFTVMPSLRKLFRF
jgi:hypothetical protein